MAAVPGFFDQWLLLGGERPLRLLPSKVRNWRDAEQAGGELLASSSLGIAVHS